VLLENLRFYKGEENNDKQFAKHLSTFADIYINDAFASCHNKHASIDAITELLPSYPGLSLVSELQNLCAAWDVKKKPQTLIIGGKKISTKISVLRSLVNKVDNLIIAGAMANNFFKALGYEIGKSFYEAEFVQAAKELYYENQKKIILPTDFIVKEAQNKLFLKDISSICEEDCMLDIGLNSCEKICQILRKSKVIIWNGPIGVYENPQYAVSSLYIARAIAYLTKNKHLTSIIGGGDALAVAKISGLSHCFSYISTGGGAFLELLEKGDLSVLKNLRV
jgi:phosphoglycerate kinase